MLTTAERRLSIVLPLTAAGLFAAALIYTLGPIVTWGKLPGTDFFRQPVFVANSVVKVTILGLACLYASGDVRRRRRYLVVLVILAHVVSVTAMISMLVSPTPTPSLTLASPARPSPPSSTTRSGLTA